MHKHLNRRVINVVTVVKRSHLKKDILLIDRNHIVLITIRNIFAFAISAKNLLISI